MGFYEDIAEALDNEGIESRVNDDTLFVPITPELEVQFKDIGVESESKINAANVFLAMADVSEEDEDFDAALVSVVFSVDAAVAEVNKHIATDQVVTVLHDLLEGTDDRISDIEFEQSHAEPMLVYAEVGDDSQLTVTLDQDGGEPKATVEFITYGEDFEELLEKATEEFWDTDMDVSEEERQAMFADIVSNVSELTQEVLDLGTYTDFDLLFDALSVAQEQARNWEELLVPLDDDFITWGDEDEDVEDIEYFDEFDDIDDREGDFDEDEDFPEDVDGDSAEDIDGGDEDDRIHHER